MIQSISCSVSATVLRLNQAIRLKAFWTSDALPFATRKRGDSGMKNAKTVVRMQIAQPRVETYLVSLLINQ